MSITVDSANNDAGPAEKKSIFDQKAQISNVVTARKWDISNTNDTKNEEHSATI